MFEGMNNKRKGIEIDPMTGLEVPKELEVYEPPYLALGGAAARRRPGRANIHW